MTDSIPSGYKPLTCDTLPGYLSSRLTPSCEPCSGTVNLAT